MQRIFEAIIAGIAPCHVGQTTVTELLTIESEKLSMTPVANRLEA
jgi:hypothetical protein